MASAFGKENQKIKVISTISQIGDMVAFVGGDRIDHLVLIPSELDPHSYELVKGDGERLQFAHIVFYNGLGLEHGASLASFLKSNPYAISIGKEIQKKDEMAILTKEGMVDPHIWMDLRLWSEAIFPIVDRLSSLDPEGKVFYEERGRLLKEKMISLDVSIKQRLATIPSEKRYLVTSHDAFRYFVRAYLKEENEIDWEKRFTAPEGLAPDGQISPMDMEMVIQFLTKHQIKVLFPESNLSRSVVGKIAKASSLMGHSVRLCSFPLYGDSMGPYSYFEAMEKNAELIAKELEE